MTVQLLASKNPSPKPPLEAYSEQLQNLSTMLDSVINHVNGILDGSKPAPSPELAQTLLQTLGAISLPSAGADKEKFEEEFEAHLAVRVDTFTSHLSVRKAHCTLPAAGYSNVVVPLQSCQVPNGA